MLVAVIQTDRSAGKMAGYWLFSSREVAEAFAARLRVRNHDRPVFVLSDEARKIHVGHQSERRVSYSPLPPDMCKKTPRGAKSPRSGQKASTEALTR